MATTPGIVMDWSVAHRGYTDAGIDTMRVLIGSSLGDLVAQNARPETGSGVTGQPTVISDSNMWREWSGSYTVPAGQTTTFFAFNSISSHGGFTTVGNYIDEITFTCAADQPIDGSTDEPLANTGGSAHAYTVANGAAALALFVVGALLVYRRRRSI